MGKDKGHIDTELLDRAIGFAVRAHSGIERRGKGFPYIVHPLEAVAIVATITPDQELLAAAALHDVVEDTPFTSDDIRAAFGDRIAGIVDKETDVEVAEQDESLSWHFRKQKAIEKLAAAPLDVKIVAIGDKLSNMRAIARDYEKVGDSLWNLFHVKERSEHEWHYRGLADSLRELSDTDAFKEFESLIDMVFGKNE